MKQYSFLQEAKLTDYFVSTIGTFRKLFSGRNYSECALKASMKGFKFHHLSRNYYGNISSIYFTTPDKTKLLRISDHWSETNLQGVNACGNIRKCYWRLIGKQNSKPEGYIQAGIIDLDKLQYIDSVKQSTPKKYFGDILKPDTNLSASREQLKMTSEPVVSRTWKHNVKYPSKNDLEFKYPSKFKGVKSHVDRVKIAARLAREEALKKLQQKTML